MQACANIRARVYSAFDETTISKRSSLLSLLLLLVLLVICILVEPYALCCTRSQKYHSLLLIVDAIQSEIMQRNLRKNEIISLGNVKTCIFCIDALLLAPRPDYFHPHANCVVAIHSKSLVFCIHMHACMHRRIRMHIH